MTQKYMSLHQHRYNTIQYNTIRVYCENTLSYNNGVLSQTEPKSGSVKARQLIYRYSTNTKKLRVKKLDMEYSIIKIITIKSDIQKPIVVQNRVELSNVANGVEFPCS